MRVYVKPTQEKSANKPALNGIHMDAQRRKRQDAVDFARASVGLEGFRTSRDDDAIAKRFVNGEIDLSEFMKMPHEPVQER